jgi:hypothetical protein
MTKDKKTPLEEAAAKRTFWKVLGGLGGLAMAVVAVVTRGKIKAK